MPARTGMLYFQGRIFWTLFDRHVLDCQKSTTVLVPNVLLTAGGKSAFRKVVAPRWKQFATFLDVQFYFDSCHVATLTPSCVNITALKTEKLHRQIGGKCILLHFIVKSIYTRTCRDADSRRFSPVAGQTVFNIPFRGIFPKSSKWTVFMHKRSTTQHRRAVTLFAPERELNRSTCLNVEYGDIVSVTRVIYSRSLCYLDTRRD